MPDLCQHAHIMPNLCRTLLMPKLCQQHALGALIVYCLLMPHIKVLKFWALKTLVEFDQRWTQFCAILIFFKIKIFKYSLWVRGASRHNHINIVPNLIIPNTHCWSYGKVMPTYQYYAKDMQNFFMPKLCGTDAKVMPKLCQIAWSFWDSNLKTSVPKLINKTFCFSAT